jgi:hypothetical protein
MKDRWGGLLALVVLGGLVLVCFGRLVAEPSALVVDMERPSVDWQRGRGIGNDLTHLFLPLHLRIGAAIHRTGRLPLWDPFGFGGRPLVGNPQAGLWYPPVWLVWWSQLPSALGWLTVAHLLWAGLGAYCLARALGVGRSAAIVAGASFEAAPYVLAQAFEGHLPHVWAASWYPWAFLAALHARAGNARGALALAAILALEIVVGHPQEGYYLGVALGIWFTAEAAMALRRRSWPAAAVRVGGFAALIALAIGLAAIEWVPELHLRAFTLNSEGLTLKNASHYHPDALNLMQLLSPKALGGPADYFGAFNYWETLLSFGWTPLVLAILAARHSKRRAAVRGFAILTLLALVFACGRHLGLFSAFYHFLPGVAWFRVPARALYLASLGVAVLAGLGTEAIFESTFFDWRASFARYRRWVLLAVTLVVVLEVCAWRKGEGPGLTERPHSASDVRNAAAVSERKDTGWKRTMRAGAHIAHDPIFWMSLGGTSLVMMALARRPAERRRGAIAIGALAFFELAANGFGLMRTAPARAVFGPDPVSAAIARVAPRDPFRIRTRDAFYDDLRAVSNGFEKTNINDLFQIQHAADLYESLYGVFGPAPPPVRYETGTEQTSEPPAPKFVQAVLDRMNVALLVTNKLIEGAPWAVAASGSSRETPFVIYSNPTALPRAYVVPRAEITPSGRPTLLKLPSVEPRAAAVLAADPLPHSEPRQPFTRAIYHSIDPDRIAVDITTAHPGLLVIADTWMPGWTAWLDGQSVPVLRANHAQRVVALPSGGTHRVVMQYRPPGIVIGMAITALSACVWAFAWVVCGLRQRRHEREPDVARDANNDMPIVSHTTRLAGVFVRPPRVSGSALDSSERPEGVASGGGTIN